MWNQKDKKAKLNTYLCLNSEFIPSKSDRDILLNFKSGVTAVALKNGAFYRGNNLLDDVANFATGWSSIAIVPIKNTMKKGIRIYLKY